MTDKRRNLIETAQILIARHFARLFSRSFHFVSLRAHCRRDACAPSKVRAFLFHDSATYPTSRKSKLQKGAALLLTIAQQFIAGIRLSGRAKSA